MPGLDLSKLETAMRQHERGGAGEPAHILLTQIEEDPDQPRQTFEDLQDLVDSIKARGVKTPISVRLVGRNRYRINHGARRFRAAQLAGLGKIPAFIDEDYLPEDQLVENVQRADLPPMDVARFLKRLIDGGRKPAELAATIGKDKSWMTRHLALLQAPSFIQDGVERGGMSVQAAYSLARAAELDPDATASLIGAREGAVPAADAARFLQDLKGEKAPDRQPGVRSSSPGASSATGLDAEARPDPAPSRGEEPSVARPRNAGRPTVTIIVRHQAPGDPEPRFGRLVLDRPAASPKSAMVAFDRGAAVVEVALSELQLFEVLADG